MHIHSVIVVVKIISFRHQHTSYLSARWQRSSSMLATSEIKKQGLCNQHKLKTSIGLWDLDLSPGKWECQLREQGNISSKFASFYDVMMFVSGCMSLNRMEETDRLTYSSVLPYLQGHIISTNKAGQFAKFI